MSYRKACLNPLEGLGGKHGSEALDLERENQYALRIRRHWNAFFALATVLEIKSLGIETLLPEGAGYHIIEIHDLCERALPHFDTFDNWWAFSCTLCDHYCDFYAMKRASPENPPLFNFRQWSTSSPDPCKGIAGLRWAG